MTNGVVTPQGAGVPYSYREATQIREQATHSASRLDLSYTDASGRAFNLSIEREETTYSLTYDRTAQLRGTRRGHPLSREQRHELKEGWKDLRKDLKRELKELKETFADMGLEVKGFRRLLHRMLKAVDEGYAERFRRHDPVEAEFAAYQAVHAEVKVAQQNLTVSMDDVDTEYWSADNTANRLVDFAVGLYRGGDREDHLEQMVRGMEQGYADAKTAFGGTLPEIARETLELAKERLGEWAQGEQIMEPPLAMVA